MQADALQALAASPLTKGISRKDLAELFASSQIQLRSYARGELIFHAGDVPERLYVLVRGAVHILQDTLSGRQIFITEIAAAGDMFGEVYLFMGAAEYDMYAQAAAAAQVLVLEGSLFSLAETGVGAAVAAMQRNLLRIFAGKAYFLNRRVRVLASGSLRGRIARWLLQMPSVPELGRESLAAELAVTRPSLSRELSAMQAEGLLQLDGRRIVVLERKKLELYL